MASPRANCHSAMTAAARRQREKEARREAILEAAEARLRDVGPHTLTMDEVAQLAELSKGALYLYFPSKDALLAAVAERRMASHLPRVRAAVLRARTGIDRVIAIVRAHQSRFREEPEVFRMMIEWLLQPDLDDRSEDFAAYRARVDEAFGMLIEALQEGRRDGSIRADVDPLHQAMNLWSSSLGVFLMQHNASAMVRRLARPVDFGRLPALHEDSLRRALAPQSAPAPEAPEGSQGDAT